MAAVGDMHLVRWHGLPMQRSAHGVVTRRQTHQHERAFGALRAPVVRVNTPDVHIPFSPAMEKPLFPNKDKVVTAVKSIITYTAPQ